jgi:quinol-cytochrome oxidoreductase complex cytochrome b subunit
MINIYPEFLFPILLLVAIAATIFLFIYKTDPTNARYKMPKLQFINLILLILICSYIFLTLWYMDSPIFQ